MVIQFLVLFHSLFKTKREELEEHFGKCGKLKEIVLPKSKIRKDANAPFGFIQYQNRLDAERAIKLLNNEPFKGRNLKVQIAVDKDTYVTSQQEGWLCIQYFSLLIGLL